MHDVRVTNKAPDKVYVTVGEEANNVTIIIEDKNGVEKQEEKRQEKKMDEHFKLPNNLKAGDVFKDKDGEEYILLYFFEGGEAAVLRKGHCALKPFGYYRKNGSNNYNESHIDFYLSEFYLPILEKKFGKDNIVNHRVDLQALNGDNMGKITRRVSILTLDRYRNNKQVIMKNINDWFWLCTPYSKHESSIYEKENQKVLTVHYTGNVIISEYSDMKAVIPFFVLASTVFEP